TVVKRNCARQGIVAFPSRVLKGTPRGTSHAQEAAGKRRGRRERTGGKNNRHSCERSGIAARLHSVEPRQRVVAALRPHSRGASGWARGARSRAKRDERRPRVYDATPQRRTSAPGGCAASTPQLNERRARGRRRAA